MEVDARLILSFEIHGPCGLKILNHLTALNRGQFFDD